MTSGHVKDGDSGNWPASEDPWDLAVILTLPDGASPVDPGPGFLDIYTAMVIGHRAGTVTSAMSKPWSGASRTFAQPSPTSNDNHQN